MPLARDAWAKYPPDWDARSLAVKEAAGWRCECTGYCHRPPRHLGADGRCVNRHGDLAYGTGARVVLTTAHLDHDPWNWLNPRLAALCAGCHVHYDREHHARSRAKRHAAELAAGGQLSLEGP